MPGGALDWRAEHKRLCKRRDPPHVAALGLFKALRNFVDPLMHPARVGEDKRPLVVEALGDMLMYLASTGEPIRGVATLHHYSVEDSIACLATAFSKVVRMQTSNNVSNAYYEVLGAMDLLCISEDEAAKAALAKL